MDNGQFSGDEKGTVGLRGTGNRCTVGIVAGLFTVQVLN